MLRSATVTSWAEQPATAGVKDGTSNTLLVAEASPTAPAAEPRYFVGFTSRFSAGGVD